MREGEGRSPTYGGSKSAKRVGDRSTSGAGVGAGAGAASDFALIQVKHLTRCEPSRISAIHSCGIHLMPAHAAIKGKARKAERERD